MGVVIYELGDKIAVPVRSRMRNLSKRRCIFGES